MNRSRPLPHFLTLILFISVIGGLVSVISLRTALDTNAERSVANVTRLGEISRMRMKAQIMISQNRGYLLTGNESLREEARETARQIERDIETLREEDTNEKIKQDLDLLTEKWAHLKEALNRAFTLKNGKSDLTKVTHWFQNTLFPLTNEWQDLLESLARGFRQDHLLGFYQAHENNRTTLSRILVVLLSTFFICLGLYGIYLEKLRRLNAELIAETDQKKESLKLLDSFIQSAPLGLALYDRQFRFFRVNNSLAEINSVDLKKHLGKTVEEVVPNVWAEVKNDFETVLRTGASIKREVTAPIPADSPLPRHWICGFFPVRNTQEEIVGIGACVSEVTELRRMEQQQRAWNDRFTLAEEAANIGMWQWDCQNRKVHFSPRCKTMLGFSADELGDTAQDWSEIMHPDDREATFKAWFGTVAGEQSQFLREFRLKQKDGSYRWILSRGRIQPLPGGKGVDLIGANIDITDKKRAETQLQEASAQLQSKEKKLLKLTQELGKSNTELERFAYIASHDLKDPLRMISTYLGLISRELSSRLSDKERTYFGYVLDGAKRLNSLVDSLLEYSRVGHTPLEVRRVHFPHLVNDVKQNLQPLIFESQAQIENQIEEEIQGDEVRLSQLLQNLLSNAIKFRKKETPPRIVLSSRPGPEGTEFTVADNGVGIAEADQELIFEIFHRGHRRKEYPGEGIGLAACKKIVESHGGRIWVTSKLGEGSAFHFTLTNSNPSLS